MPLAAGLRLGAYEIQDLLGAGGMGEVYRARDLKLKRDVALKVLPAAFTADPERLARLQREAELLAAGIHACRPMNVRSFSKREKPTTIYGHWTLRGRH